MGRGDSGGRGVALLRRSRGVSRQAALCNQLVQEAQTGEYGNILGALLAEQGDDEFWNDRRLDTLRDELVYDLTARAMLAHQRDLRRMLRLIEAEGLDTETARLLTTLLSGRLRRHVTAGRFTSPDQAREAADIEFARALTHTLADQAAAESEQALTYFLDRDYPRFQAAWQARRDPRSLGSLISLDQWRELFAHLLIADPAEPRQQAHDYLCACLTGDRDFAERQQWQRLAAWSE